MKEEEGNRTTIAHRRKGSIPNTAGSLPQVRPFLSLLRHLLSLPFPPLLLVSPIIHTLRLGWGRSLLPMHHVTGEKGKGKERKRRWIKPRDPLGTHRLHGGRARRNPTKRWDDNGVEGKERIRFPHFFLLSLFTMGFPTARQRRCKSVLRQWGLLFLLLLPTCCTHHSHPVRMVTITIVWRMAIHRLPFFLLLMGCTPHLASHFLFLHPFWIGTRRLLLLLLLQHSEAEKGHAMDIEWCHRTAWTLTMPEKAPPPLLLLPLLFTVIPHFSILRLLLRGPIQKEVITKEKGGRAPTRREKWNTRYQAAIATSSQDKAVKTWKGVQHQRTLSTWWRTRQGRKGNGVHCRWILFLLQ